MAELDGLVLFPVVRDDKLSSIHIRIKDAPGLELHLTATAAAELCEGLTHLLEVTDWDVYNNTFKTTMPLRVEKKVIPKISVEQEPESWDKLETLKKHVSLNSRGELVSAAWLKMVPTEHLAAVSRLMNDVWSRYMGQRATKDAFESFLHELYGGMATYLHSLNPRY